MATNRNNTPATPTTTAQTDDAARGGLFATPDLTNVVTGLEIAGTSVANDSTITIRFRQDGNEFDSVSFTLNQAANGNLMVDLPDSGGGMSNPSGGSNPFISGRVDSTRRLIILERTTPPHLEVPLGDLVTNDQVSAAILNAALTSIDELPDVNGINRDEGRILQVDANNQLTYIDLPVANIDASSFDSTAPTTVSFADVGNLVRAEATPTWIGSASNSNVVPDVNGTVQATSIALDTFATGFVLRDDGNGAYTITTPTPVPAGPTPPTPGPTPRVANGSIFAPNMEVVIPFSINPGTNGGMIANEMDAGVIVEHTPPGATTPTPIAADVDILTGGTNYQVTIPEDESNFEGEYEISTTPTVTIPDPTDPNAPPTTMTLAPVTTRYERFSPFFQHTREIVATDFADEASLRVLTQSMTEWQGEIETQVSGGTIFFAVESRELSDQTIYASVGTDPRPTVNPRVVHLGTFTVQDSELEDIEFNSFRTQADAGDLLNRFRDVRRPVPPYTAP